ncbi:hypothetical protein GGR57DRAFT_513250 [Xylariaceae sp. FL1272]|nr:hypothetical protein GGR57DRAFT_513250 [Xylariaceae sp. FL1272]
MTYNLLFCTAEEVKPLVPEVLAAKEGAERSIYPYALVESRQGFQPGQRFRDRLQANEIFETDFIGASIDECGAWALEKEGHKYLCIHTIILLDARSAKDKTVTVWRYPLEFEAPFLRRDQEPHTWYPFRIH